MSFHKFGSQTMGARRSELEPKEVDSKEFHFCCQSGIPGLRELLDLEDLAFAQGSHFMANKKCTLPEGKTNLIAVNFPST